MGDQGPLWAGHSPFQSSGSWPSWQVDTDGCARRTGRAVSSTTMSMPAACLDSHRALSPGVAPHPHASSHSKGVLCSLWGRGHGVPREGGRTLTPAQRPGLRPRPHPQERSTRLPAPWRQVPPRSQRALAVSRWRPARVSGPAAGTPGAVSHTGPTVRWDAALGIQTQPSPAPAPEQRQGSAQCHPSRQCLSPRGSGVCSGHTAIRPTLGAPLPHLQMALARGDSHHSKGRTGHGGQAESNLEGFSEALGLVYIQPENQCPQDPKHNEESPTQACKFLEERRPGTQSLAFGDPLGEVLILDVRHHQGAKTVSLGSTQVQAG